MFTGLIEDVGKIGSLRIGSRAAVLKVQTGLPVRGMRLGASIAVNGVCLTVVGFCDYHWSHGEPSTGKNAGGAFGKDAVRGCRDLAWEPSAGRRRLCLEDWTGRTPGKRRRREGVPSADAFVAQLLVVQDLSVHHDDVLPEAHRLMPSEDVDDRETTEPESRARRAFLLRG